MLPVATRLANRTMFSYLWRPSAVVTFFLSKKIFSLEFLSPVSSLDIWSLGTATNLIYLQTRSVLHQALSHLPGLSEKIVKESRGMRHIIHISLVGMTDGSGMADKESYRENKLQSKRKQ